MTEVIQNSKFKISNLAPIVLFVYNRPWHTQQTIEALKKNELADKSDLIIYSDAPKKENAWPKVQELRDYLKSITGFKSLKIIERKENWGLAKSIISGVTEVVNKYGRIIVLEDDILTSQEFLKYMNHSLEAYQNKQKIWHINSWNYNINNEEDNEVFLCRLMHCWGWATWHNRWEKFEKNVDDIIGQYTREKISHFNLDDTVPYWSQIELNKNRTIDTWAVFWYATIHKNNGLCITPVNRYSNNIGTDGTGVHCGNEKYEDIKLATKINLNIVNEVKENVRWVKEIKTFLKNREPGLITKIWLKLKIESIRMALRWKKI